MQESCSEIEAIFTGLFLVLEFSGSKHASARTPRPELSTFAGKELVESTSETSGIVSTSSVFN
jgi:hypothetical protein